MPHNADLRAGYFTINFNMSWYYKWMEHYFEENNIEDIVFLGDKEHQERYEKMFEEFIEGVVCEQLHRIIKTEFKFTECELTCELLYNETCAYVKKHPNEIAFKMFDDEKQEE